MIVDPFVRIRDGRLMLKWNDGEWRERPLALRERILWRLAAKTPRP